MADGNGAGGRAREPARTRSGPGLATACGSLPHADVADATELLLDTVPRPARPRRRLPNRHPAEGMLGQAASGMTGRRSSTDGGALVVADPDAVGADDVGDRRRRPAAPTPSAPRWRSSTPSPPRGWRRPGEAPVHRAGHARRPRSSPPASPLGGRSRPPTWPRRRRARALVAATRAPPAGARPLVVVVDEPSLGAATLGDAPLGVEEAVDLVSGALAAVEADAVSGLHCCAVADWGAVLRAGPQLAVAPRRRSPRRVRAADLGPFLERGGWVAWGAVPTGGPLGSVDGGGTGRLWRRLAGTVALRWPTAASIPCCCAGGPS